MQKPFLKMGITLSAGNAMSVKKGPWQFANAEEWSDGRMPIFHPSILPFFRSPR
jgi:hypothetical protein